jgi:hypothetical protein
MVPRDSLIRSSSPFHAAAFLVSVASTFASAAPSPGAVFQVDTHLDGHDTVIDGVCATTEGNGGCSLRAAAEEAAAQGADDTIHLPASLPIEITLGALPDHTAGQGSLSIEGHSSIVFAFPTGASRFITSSGDLTLRDLGLELFGAAGEGGAVLSTGTLAVERCDFRSNSAQSGGSIAASGVLEIRRSYFMTSSASLGGGAVLFTGSSFLCEVCSFWHNDALNGGALAMGGNANPTIRILRSHFFDNEAGQFGGAIQSVVNALPASVAIENTTIEWNRAGSDGGGVFFFGPAEVYSSTISANRADSDLSGHGEGGGVYVTGGFGVPSGIVLANSILSGSVATVTLPGPVIESQPQDCAGGTIASNGFNIIRTFVACAPPEIGCCHIEGAASAADPLLEPPAFNGGATLTNALVPGSPAIDAGDPSGCDDVSGTPLTVDQRGGARPEGAACDLGAFEYGALIFDDDFEPWNWKWSEVVH